MGIVQLWCFVVAMVVISSSTATQGSIGHESTPPDLPETRANPIFTFHPPRKVELSPGDLLATSSGVFRVKSSERNKDGEKNDDFNLNNKRQSVGRENLKNINKFYKISQGQEDRKIKNSQNIVNGDKQLSFKDLNFEGQKSILPALAVSPLLSFHHPSLQKERLEDLSHNAPSGVSGTEVRRDISHSRAEDKRLHGMVPDQRNSERQNKDVVDIYFNSPSVRVIEKQDTPTHPFMRQMVDAGKRTMESDLSRVAGAIDRDTEGRGKLVSSSSKKEFGNRISEKVPNSIKFLQPNFRSRMTLSANKIEKLLSNNALPGKFHSQLDNSREKRDADQTLNENKNASQSSNLDNTDNKEVSISRTETTPPSTPVAISTAQSKEIVTTENKTDISGTGKTAEVKLAADNTDEQSSNGIKENNAPNHTIDINNGHWSFEPHPEVPKNDTVVTFDHATSAPEPSPEDQGQGHLQSTASPSSEVATNSNPVPEITDNSLSNNAYGDSGTTSATVPEDSPGQDTGSTQQPGSEPGPEPEPEPEPETTENPEMKASPEAETTPEVLGNVDGQPASEPGITTTDIPGDHPTSEPKIGKVKVPADLISEPDSVIRGEAEGSPENEPNGEPEGDPTKEPNSEPTKDPNAEPEGESTGIPSLKPTAEPTNEPEPEGENSTPKPETEPEPESETKYGLPSAEPGPEWKEAKKVWRFAWEAHIYAYGGLFGAVGLYTLLSLLRLWRIQRLLSKPYFFSLNLLILVMCGTRCFYLLYDAYNSKGSFSITLNYLLYSIPFPCLTSAFSILLYALLKATHMHLVSPAVQRMPVMAFIVVFHFVLSIATDFLLGMYAGMQVLLFVCQMYFIVWGLFLFFGYAHIFRKIYSHALKRQKNLLYHTTSDNSANSQPKSKGRFTLSTAVKVTFFTSICGLITIGLEIYAIVGVYKTFTFGRPQPWPWWLYHTVLRLVEFLMCLTMSYVASQPFRYKTDKTKSCTCGILCAPCAEILCCGTKVNRESAGFTGWSEVDTQNSRYTTKIPPFKNGANGSFNTGSTHNIFMDERTDSVQLVSSRSTRTSQPAPAAATVDSDFTGFQPPKNQKPPSPPIYPEKVQDIHNMNTFRIRDGLVNTGYTNNSEGRAKQDDCDQINFQLKSSSKSSLVSAEFFHAQSSLSLANSMNNEIEKAFESFRIDSSNEDDTDSRSFDLTLASSLPEMKETDLISVDSIPVESSPREYPTRKTENIQEKGVDPDSQEMADCGTGFKNINLLRRVKSSEVDKNYDYSLIDSAEQQKLSRSYSENCRQRKLSNPARYSSSRDNRHYDQYAVSPEDANLIDNTVASIAASFQADDIHDSDEINV